MSLQTFRISVMKQNTPSGLHHVSWPRVLLVTSTTNRSSHLVLQPCVCWIKAGDLIFLIVITFNNLNHDDGKTLKQLLFVSSSTSAKIIRPPALQNDFFRVSFPTCQIATHWDCKNESAAIPERQFFEGLGNPEQHYWNQEVLVIVPSSSFADAWGHFMQKNLLQIKCSIVSLICKYQPLVSER